MRGGGAAEAAGRWEAKACGWETPRFSISVLFTSAHQLVEMGNSVRNEEWGMTCSIVLLNFVKLISYT